MVFEASPAFSEDRIAGYERTMAAYRHAVTARYRFYSYGDAMLIL